MSTDAVLIDFDAISEGDTIRVVRSNDKVNIVLQGIAEWQDDDGDWNTGDELLTFRGSDYEEEYYLVKSAALPTEPGSLITFDNPAGRAVFGLKTYEDDQWLLTYPDGSTGVFGSLTVATKGWTEV